MKKRQHFYAWVTWLAQLLAEEKFCKYAVSMLTRYQFDKAPSNYNSSAHEEMVIERAAQLQSKGWTVYVENQNSFKYQGQIYPICVSGRPDIIAIKGNRLILEDCKTGKRKDSHKMQVLIYMLLVPLASETKDLCQGKRLHGRLIYRDGEIEIPVSAVDRQFKHRLREIIAIICNSTLPKPTPSNWECRYCNIPSGSCHSRIGGDFNLAA